MSMSNSDLAFPYDSVGFEWLYSEQYGYGTWVQSGACSGSIGERRRLAGKGCEIRLGDYDKTHDETDSLKDTH